MNTNEENNPILQNVASSFMRNGNNINDNNTSFDLTRFYPTIAAAGAALAGGALYYLLNIMGKSKKNDESIIDFKNQTREVKVIFSFFLFLSWKFFKIIF